MRAESPENIQPLEIAKIEQRLLALISEQLLDPRNKFSATSDLYAEGLDSMAIMQLLILIEERFSVRLSEADVTRENFSSVRHLASLISRARG